MVHVVVWVRLRAEGCPYYFIKLLLHTLELTSAKAWAFMLATASSVRRLARVGGSGGAAFAVAKGRSGWAEIERWRSKMVMLCRAT